MGFRESIRHASEKNATGPSPIISRNCAAMLS